MSDRAAIKSSTDVQNLTRSERFVSFRLKFKSPLTEELNVGVWHVYSG